MAAYRGMNGEHILQGRNTASPRFNMWGPGNRESKTNSYGWGTSFTDDDDGCQDHVCRPIIIDANGRRRPIVAYGPNHNTNETITEHVSAPQVSTYRTSPPVEAGVTKDYRAFNNGSSWPASAYQDRPPTFHEFISKIQDEASQPTWISPESSSYRQQKPHTYGYGGTNSYGRPSEAGINRWNKPARDPYFDISGGRNQMALDGNQDPDINTDGGWVRPSRPGWSKPPGNGSRLSEPTNDIGTAIEYLKDSANATTVNGAPPQRQFAVPTAVMPKVHTYTTTIGSWEAQQKYGGYSGPPQTLKPANTYSTAIDGREAARRYNGEMM